MHAGSWVTTNKVHATWDPESSRRARRGRGDVVTGCAASGRPTGRDKAEGNEEEDADDEDEDAAVGRWA